MLASMRGAVRWVEEDPAVARNRLEPAKMSMMRYSRVMVRSTAVAMCVSLLGCATAGPAVETSVLEQAVAEDEDLGDPRPSTEERDAASQARAQAALEDPSAEHIDFDGDEANDAPVDMVMVPPDRSPSKSLMQDIVMGPSS